MSHKEQIAKAVTNLWNSKSIPRPPVDNQIVTKIESDTYKNFSYITTLDEFVNAIPEGKIFMYNKETIEKKDIDATVDFYIGETRNIFYIANPLVSVVFSKQQHFGFPFMRIVSDGNRCNNYNDLQSSINILIFIYETYFNLKSVITLKSRPVVKTKEELPMIRDFLLKLLEMRNSETKITN